MTLTITDRREAEDGWRYDVRLEDGEERKGLAEAEVRALAEDDGSEDGLEPEKPGKLEAAGEPAKFFQYELEAGIVTINELRASKGLPPDERFARMTLPEYIAANPATYQAATMARSVSAAPAPEKAEPAEPERKLKPGTKVRPK